MDRFYRNRFQDFFEEDKYVLLKNHLYNYLLRKRAIEKVFRNEEIRLIIEVGSGLSPVMTKTSRIIYSDLSYTALSYLKRSHRKGFYVVADVTNLPFKPDVFSHTICSEVLEHIEDDQGALNEMLRVLMLSGRLIITFPHRKIYFANDDRFVNHYRRYETYEMADQLRTAGFKPVEMQKILGPLEKITMSLMVFCFSILHKVARRKEPSSTQVKWKHFFVTFFKFTNRLYMGLVWLDAKLMPESLSTVKLIKAKKMKN